MSFNEILSIGSLILTLAILIRGTGIWQGKQEASESNLGKRIEHLEQADNVSRREFDGWTTRVERLEDRTFRQRN